MNAKPREDGSLFPRGIFLLAGSLIAGAIAGLAGYWIGQYVYILFVFPFLLLAIGALLFLPLLRFFATTSTLVNGLCGFLLGFMILLGFHYVEYSLFRSRMIQVARLAQPAGETSPSASVDAFLEKETGLPGFPGYMIYQQNQYRPYVYYFTRGDKITGSLVFNLWRRNAWLYLAGEALVLLVGSALSGVGLGKWVRRSPGQRGWIHRVPGGSV